MLTRGDRGTIAVERDGTLHDRGASSAETADPIGTGDAFVGGVLARSLEDGTDVSRAPEYGSATAALKRTLEDGLAVVTPEQDGAVIDDPDVGIAG